MRQRWVYALLLATAAGAITAQPVSPAVAAVLVLGAVLTWRRWPLICCAAAAVTASALAATAHGGLRLPDGDSARVVDTVAVLRSDPAPSFGGLRVILSVDGDRRAVADVRGAHAGVLRPMLSGERVRVVGRLRPLDGRAQDLLAPRHVGARLDVTRLQPHDDGNAVARIANSIRRCLDRGARGLPPGRRELFLGLVLGDDRHHRPVVVDDFRASGLSHLLAVSGQNVSFVMLLASPLLSRLRLMGRLAASVALLALFAVLTRAEPSVLRACFVAGVAAVSFAAGRPQQSLRILAVAATLLLLADPLLVHSLGFRLSVAASAGILLLARPIERRLHGPAALRDTVAVTLAAQAAVLPVLLPTFGGAPLVSLLANALTVPLAGVVMVWGLVAGLPAGLLPDPFASWLHAPTSILVGWIGGVARVCAQLPLGEVRAPHALAAAGAVVVAVVLRRHPAAVRVAVAAGVITVAVAPVAEARRASVQSRRGVTVARETKLWRSGDVTIVSVGRSDPAQVLPALRREGVWRPDVLVLHDLAHEDDLVARLRPRTVVRGTDLAPASQLQLGTLRVELAPP